MRKIWLPVAVTVILLTQVFGLVACGNKNNDQQGGVPGIITPDGNPIQLGAGTKIGFYADRGASAQRRSFTNNLTISSGWTNVLKKAMGICDRENSNGGLANCNAWKSGYNDVSILFDGNSSRQARLIISSEPNASVNYSYQLPSGSQLLVGLIGGYWGNNPYEARKRIDLGMTIWPINNNQGFELRGYAPANSFGQNQLFQLQVAQGKLEYSNLNFDLYLNSSHVANGLFNRCQTQTCGY